MMSPETATSHLRFYRQEPQTLEGAFSCEKYLLIGTRTRFESYYDMLTQKLNLSQVTEA